MGEKLCSHPSDILSFQTIYICVNWVWGDPKTQEKKKENLECQGGDNSRAKFYYIHYSLKSCYSLFITLGQKK